MKRELKITIKNDYNHYALIEQVNNRENEINRGIFLDKDQYEQLRQHFVSGCDADSDKLVECSNCGDKVEMISSGEFCPHCFC